MVNVVYDIVTSGQISGDRPLLVLRMVSNAIVNTWEACDHNTMGKPWGKAQGKG